LIIRTDKGREVEEIVSMEFGKPRWPADFARRIADELVEALRPRCEQLCIAGSLRRGKAEVGDIEILYVSRIGAMRSPGELFARSGSLADELIDQWLTEGVLTKRPKNGVTAWGPLNKLARHTASGVNVDLFAATRERWFVSLVVRTGSWEMNTQLAASALRRGLKLHVSVNAAIERLDTDELIFPQSEREVFELCGMPYREPAER
jgi:DNA polymerase/3'-5' exonuclease PolX